MKKTIKKFIWAFLFFILFLQPVAASNIVKFDYIEDVYYVVSLDDYYFSHKEPFIYLNDKLVYCLEPEKKVFEGKEYILGDISNINLTEEQLKKIELIGHYGYGYGNHDNYKYYLAAQELIWEISRPNIIMYWTNEEYGNNKISVEKEKEEIMYFVNTHYKIPALNNLVMALTINQSTISVTEEFIRNYEIYDSGPHDIQIKDNKIHINTSDTFVGKSKVKFRRIVDKEKGKTEIYTLNDYQSLIYTYNIDQRNFSFEIDIKVGNLTIQKIDSETLENKPQGEASFDGTKFEIYNETNKLIKEVTLDNSGSITINNLGLGLYYVKEVKSGTGYYIDDNKYSIWLSQSKLNQTLTIKNSVIKSELQIEKTYGDLHDLEEGAEFLIKDKFGKEFIIKTDINGQAGITLPYGKYQIKQIKGIANHYFIDDFEIDINETTEKIINYKLHNNPIKVSLVINKKDKITGELILDSAIFKIYDIQNQKYLTRDNNDIFITNKGIVKIDNLYLGKYIIEEVHAPLGYVKGENLEIELLENDINNNKIELSYFNEFILGKVEILKEGINYNNEKELLDGVEFEIYAKEDIIISNKVYYQKDELIEEIITSNGIAISKYLPTGKYYIKEVKTVDGYNIDNNIYEVEINDKKIMRFEFINNILKNKVIVNKNGIDLKNNILKLNDVKFEIYAREDIIINNKIYFEENELIEEIITNNGLAVSKYLPIGKYYIKEVKTINGYEIDNNIYNFDIDNEKELTITINNKMILGSLKINKIGVNNKEELSLDGIKFGVFAKEDIVIANKIYYQKDELIEEIITRNGVAVLENLVVGNYYIKELETLSNYELNEEIYYFEVKNDALNEITIHNLFKEEIYDVFEIPDTETKSNKLSVFLVILFSYIINKYVKK